MALIVVMAVALAAVGIGVFLVAMGDDDDGRASGSTEPASATAPGSAGSSPDDGSLGASETSEAPATSEPVEGVEPTDPEVPIPSVPEVPPTGTDLSVPEGFPQPEGATPDALTGGLSVPGTTADAAAFYEDALPGAGYTVDRLEVPGVGAVLTVTGNDVSGQLVFVDLGFGSTSILWTAT